jgi:threonine/homoserine/homoserine lactone efflux protein
MEPVEITWGRAFKVWWSFSWRGFVLSLLAMIPLQIILFMTVFSRMPRPGQKGDPAEFAKMIPLLMLIWLVMMALVFVLQGYAMRWMLRDAKWSDFRIAVLPKDS